MNKQGHICCYFTTTLSEYFVHTHTHTQTNKQTHTDVRVFNKKKLYRDL